MDYESEVEDDLLPIFRKGEVGIKILYDVCFLDKMKCFEVSEELANHSWRQEFNYGLEFVLLVSFADKDIGSIEDALVSLERLIMGFPSLIVQSTQGLFELNLYIVVVASNFPSLFYWYTLHIYL